MTVSSSPLPSSPSDNTTILSAVTFFSTTSLPRTLSSYCTSNVVDSASTPVTVPLNQLPLSSQRTLTRAPISITL